MQIERDRDLEMPCLKFNWNSGISIDGGIGHSGNGGSGSFHFHTPPHPHYTNQFYFESTFERLG